MMKNHFLSPQIGIVGGAGPMAGALLFQKIIEICQEQYSCKDDGDFPSILLFSYPFVDMLQNPREAQRSIIKQQLNNCISKLADSGAETVVIACNTLHQFLEPSKVKNTALVHMIDETRLCIERSQVNRSLILCTTTSAQCKLHSRYFECSYPDDNFQTNIQELIHKILAGKHSRKDAKNLCKQLNDFLSSNEKEKIGIVLGCTEFSVFNEQFSLRLNGLSERFHVFDPIQIVAEKICRNIFNK